MVNKKCRLFISCFQNFHWIFNVNYVFVCFQHNNTYSLSQFENHLANLALLKFNLSLLKYEQNYISSKKLTQPNWQNLTGALKQSTWDNKFVYQVPNIESVDLQRIRKQNSNITIKVQCLLFLITKFPQGLPFP